MMTGSESPSDEGFHKSHHLVSFCFLFVITELISSAGLIFAGTERSTEISWRLTFSHRLKKAEFSVFCSWKNTYRRCN